jgi:multiple sugar transport system substrate-binding protein
MNLDTLSKFGILALILSALGIVWYYSQPGAASSRTIVRYLTYETGQEQMALVREIERRFEEKNPDIDVQVEFNNMARDKIYVEVASGTAPDTWYCVTDDIPRLAYKDAVEPINEWVKRDKLDLGVYFPQIVNGLQYPQQRSKVLVDGPIYAMPIHFSTDLLCYNVDAFREAGVPLPTDDWTWDQMVAAARKLTKRDKNGRTVRFGLFLPDAQTAIEGNGGQVFNADFTKCVIDNPTALEAIEQLRDLRFKDKVAPTAAQIQDTSSMQMFKLGQLAMLPGRTYMVVDFNKIKDFTYDVTLLPGMKRNVERLAVGGVALSKASKNKEAAWRWAKFYCSPDGGMQILSKLKNCVTAVESQAYSPQYFLQPPPKNVKAMITSLQDAYIVTPPIVGTAEWLNRIRTPMFDNMLRTPDANIPQMLKEFQSETNKLLADEPPKQDSGVRSQDSAHGD